MRGLGDPRMAESWRRFLVTISETDLMQSQSGWKHRDAMVAVVLARIFSSVVPQLPESVRTLRAYPLPVDVVQYSRIDPRSAYTRYDQEHAYAWIRTICVHELLPLLEIEQLDVDALRLMGLFRSGSEQLMEMDLADLYNVILKPELTDVVDFSLELIPSLLEVKKEMGQQNFGIDGYASIERTGHLDDVMLSQLAYDDDIFYQKLVDNELFYHTHERQFENEKRTHYVLVDGSASMRGVREVFARALALALCKRLSVLGEETELRFFDSRLYEGVKVGQGHHEVPYVLQFRTERGRNYAAVIEQLNAEFAAPRRSRSQALVYLLTHGECRFPVDELRTLAAHTPIYGVFILPSGPLELPYLDVLHRVHVVDEEAIAHGRRAGHARKIIDSVERDLKGGERGRGGP